MVKSVGRAVQIGCIGRDKMMTIEKNADIHFKHKNLVKLTRDR